MGVAGRVSTLSSAAVSLLKVCLGCLRGSQCHRDGECSTVAFVAARALLATRTACLQKKNDENVQACRTNKCDDDVSRLDRWRLSNVEVLELKRSVIRLELMCSKRESELAHHKSFGSCSDGAVSLPHDAQSECIPMCMQKPEEPKSVEEPTAAPALSQCEHTDDAERRNRGLETGEQQQCTATCNQPPGKTAQSSTDSADHDAVRPSNDIRPSPTEADSSLPFGKDSPLTASEAINETQDAAPHVVARHISSAGNAHTNMHVQTSTPLIAVASPRSEAASSDKACKPHFFESPVRTPSAGFTDSGRPVHFSARYSDVNQPAIASPATGSQCSNQSVGSESLWSSPQPTPAPHADASPASKSASQEVQIEPAVEDHRIGWDTSPTHHRSSMPQTRDSFVAPSGRNNSTASPASVNADHRQDEWSTPRYESPRNNLTDLFEPHSDEDAAMNLF